MRCRCRKSFVRMIVGSCSGVFLVAFILIVLLLSPSLIDGPDNVYYRSRSRCNITSINYLDNLCPRDSSDDIFALIYQPNWEKCILIEIIAQELNSEKNYTYKWRESFQDPTDAFIAVSRKYREGQEIDCIINTIHDFWDPDKKEVIVFIAATTSLFSLFLLTLICFFYMYRRNRQEVKQAGKKKKKKKEKNENKEEKQEEV